MKSINEIPNKAFLLELQNRLWENKITEKQLAKTLSELTFTHNEQELATAYEEWTQDPEEQAEIKAWKATEKDNWEK